ncbi:MAG: hypothetical protein ACKO3K_11040 [Cuspidothrix sp.]
MQTFILAFICDKTADGTEIANWIEYEQPSSYFVNCISHNLWSVDKFCLLLWVLYD